MSEHQAPCHGWRNGRRTHGGMVDPALAKASGIVPATRDADGNVTIHPERLEVTPVSRQIFEWITLGDEFVDGTCLACGDHAAMFVCAGRFVRLCPSCVLRRIDCLRRGAGPADAAWVTLLDREAGRQAAFEMRKKEEPYTVAFDDLWKCARCGALIQPKDARYHHEPGQVVSPPYCDPCAEALGKDGAAT
jgi:hypothetical protein